MGIVAVGRAFTGIVQASGHPPACVQAVQNAMGNAIAGLSPDICTRLVKERLFSSTTECEASLAEAVSSHPELKDLISPLKTLANKYIQVLDLTKAMATTLKAPGCDQLQKPVDQLATAIVDYMSPEMRDLLGAYGEITGVNGLQASYELARPSISSPQSGGWFSFLSNNTRSL